MKALLQLSWPSLSPPLPAHLWERGNVGAEEKQDTVTNNPTFSDWIHVSALLQRWCMNQRFMFTFSSKTNGNPLQELFEAEEAQIKAQGVYQPVFVGSIRERAFLDACFQGAAWALRMFMDKKGFNPRGPAEQNNCVQKIMTAYLQACEMITHLDKIEDKDEDSKYRLLDAATSITGLYGGFIYMPVVAQLAGMSYDHQVLTLEKYQTDLLATLEVLLEDASTPDEHRVRLTKELLQRKKLVRGSSFGLEIILEPQAGALFRLLTSSRRRVHSAWFSEWINMTKAFAEIRYAKVEQTDASLLGLASNKEWMKLMLEKQKKVALEIGVEFVIVRH
jgi:hypothetical protein